jgi:hypothetical protein
VANASYEEPETNEFATVLPRNPTRQALEKDLRFATRG